MRELTFVGLSDDGSSLVLTSGDGTRYTVPCDERLEAAVRADRSRLRASELPLDGTSPRDIQMRIRHGQTPEDISAASGLSVEHVMRFAGPVLAEREHVATAARQVELRDRGTGLDVATTVTEALLAGGGDPDTLDWDAWRRDDGRWSVLASWEPVESVAGGATAALWIYDTGARTVVADDPASSWLFGDRLAGGPPAEDGRPVLVGLPAPDDVASWAPDPVEDDAAFIAVVDDEPRAEVVELLDRPPAEPDDSSPLDDLYDTLPGLSTPEPRKPRLARRKATKASDPAAPETPKRGKGRASVPSWDEILFGTRQPDN